VTPCSASRSTTTSSWRTDRLAKHYGAIVEPCPPRRGNRKGAVESSVRYLCGRWWRTMTATSPEDAQRSLDAFCAGPGDTRTRRTATGPVTVAVPVSARSCRTDRAQASGSQHRGEAVPDSGQQRTP